jgi:hypothetical protein
MKPHQIVLLVVAGALGGALLMKVTQGRAPDAAPAARMAAAPAPAPASAAASVPPAEPVAEPASEPRPSPLAAPREAAKPRPAHVMRVVKKVASAPPPEPALVVAAQEPPAAAPAAEPVMPAPAPQPIPPAQLEPEYVTPPPPAPPEPQKVTLNAGMLIPVRLVDGLSTERNAPGDLFTATLDKELVVDGFIIAERGARVEGRVVASDRGGRLNGLASIAVELARVHLSDGQWVALPTDSFERRAEPSHRDDAAKIGAGAAIGAVIGAIAGGGKGAAIGAGAGGAAGAGTVAATRGKPATLTSETRLSFRLRSPVTITERR